ncbi:hypothetical protein ACFVYE_42955, partial [Streptomyces sp. NPDC058239]
RRWRRARPFRHPGPVVRRSRRRRRTDVVQFFPRPARPERLTTAVLCKMRSGAFRGAVGTRGVKEVARLGAPAGDDDRVAPAGIHLGNSLADAVGTATCQRFRGLPGV